MLNPNKSISYIVEGEPHLISGASNSLQQEKCIISESEVALQQLSYQQTQQGRIKSVTLIFSNKKKQVFGKPQQFLENRIINFEKNSYFISTLGQAQGGMHSVSAVHFAASRNNGDVPHLIPLLFQGPRQPLAYLLFSHPFAQPIDNSLLPSAHTQLYY